MPQAFGRRLREAGLVASMGSVGDAYDNAMAESFYTPPPPLRLGQLSPADYERSHQAQYSSAQP